MKWIKINSEEDLPPDGKNIFIYSTYIPSFTEKSVIKKISEGYYNSKFDKYVWKISKEIPFNKIELGYVEFMLNNFEDYCHKQDIKDKCDWLVTHWMLPEPPQDN